MLDHVYEWAMLYTPNGLLYSFITYSWTVHDLFLPQTAINGVWTIWSGSWSSSCGYGTRTLTRTCTNPAPSCGGATCIGSSTNTESTCCVNAYNGAWVRLFEIAFHKSTHKATKADLCAFFVASEFCLHNWNSVIYLLGSTFLFLVVVMVSMDCHVCYFDKQCKPYTHMLLDLWWGALPRFQRRLQ